MKTDIFCLDGRVALVTGATGHLGKSMVGALCEVGCHVILNGRDKKSLESFMGELLKYGYKVSIAPFDIHKTNEIKSAIKDIEKKHSRLDVIVNNAYSYPKMRGDLKNISKRDFNQSFDVAVTGSYHLIHYAKNILIKTALLSDGGASVINIASMYGMISSDPDIYGDSGFDDPPYYGAAKAGLIQMTRYLACRLAHLKIRINCISPGAFPPESLAKEKPQLYAKICKKSPMRRIGIAKELKGPLIFFASDASSFVTGTNLPIDGGWTSW
jgi:NAD(P)-dependent dehydrogenase (short-subunit alcohol dehydrogenase family)